MLPAPGHSGTGARLGLRSLTAALGLGLVATPLAFVVSPASAADPVDITLLNINDFHGRIDGNTTKVATTIETARREAGEANTLFLSAGDNIGASLFASSNGADVPTLDVLDALDLAASAVGNHEFDRGFADLAGRVQDEADFAYLGANVYQRGTTTPALDEYATFEVAGVTVGVIGTVTEETPSLVTPTGIESLTFGDPVEATNRVATQLTDGDEANGEADVVVAEYHEGARPAATLEAAVAEGGVFARIVQDTSAAVDVIFTGHTHAEYAWTAPVPGQPGRTRPVVQTGSYGDNVGRVDLAYDAATDTVTAAVARNVDRAASADLTLPRVAEVKAIVDAAIAEADRVGNVAVGRVSDDVTTAFSGGTYGPDGYTGGKRDDRESESTLGNLVADALRDTPIPATGRTADIGVVNSGGLRNELFFAGDLSTSPENTDGVVTFEEANAVLPFVNNVSYVELSGASFERVLEQQWQTTLDGSTPSRAFIHLGLSDNVQTTLDPSRPLGDRVTSVTIDGEPLDPTATYTVSTFSFLAAGGDNFRAFTEGVATDTGKIDRDLWIDDFLGDGEVKSPDFARRQVYTDAPAVVRAKEEVTFSLARLDLTSLGAPANSVVSVALVKPQGNRKELGMFPVVGGAAHVSFTVPAGVPQGSYLEVRAPDSGTTFVVPAVRR
ncbi:bifunctional metallophosphatase/5'-nucleotidase [Nocardioides perillae]|uniref:5'-nucleotidase n=1 Tax=Nocardioides perillae TaxID=1119534 RepID=A0A7Y9UV71_9ACTN|nr:bifunctional UDP-sugar hydrolase/5'-nucleotidase [Nocardioides perillae]NYG55665.1 5'-nucleotidase [Nocardioides perillae]